MDRDRFHRQSLGVLHNKIKQSRVLLVGAGGIGCELLKNLVLTGFGEIHIIDLDTIDLSNLNRQFLFRHEHIKKPKALVAKEVAQKFNPKVKLTAHLANIKDSQFNIDWFSSFALVFNALDNLDARRHVNKMCLAADVPLIESGTTGFRGHAQVIKKGKTACYDCSPKELPTSFPVCTIRSTPSQLIHCIVWAKSYLLAELFGVSEDETPELDTTTNAENAEEIAKLKAEAEALKKIRKSMGSDRFARQVFDKVFKQDVERLKQMEDMWKSRRPPEPLSYDELAREASGISASISQTDQQTWTLPESFIVLQDSLTRLSRRLAEEQAEAVKNGLPKPVISFDKDDDDTLDFVTAAANLRAAIFGIGPKSKFDTKQMAGNIIPAIATTNAMIAGLCVIQAFKVLRGDYGRTKMVFLDRSNMTAQPFDPPNPDCAVCSIAMSRVQIDPDRATLNDLVAGVLRLKLGYGEEITLMNDKGIIYDPDLEDNLEKSLTELNIKDSTFVIVKDDEDENPRIDLQLAIEAKKMDEGSIPVVLVESANEKFEIARKAKKATGPPADVGRNGDVVVNGSNGLTKRKREADEIELVEEAPAKRTPTLQATKSTDMAVVVDEEDGVILIE